MTRADGTPVNAVFGFSNMIAKLMRDYAPGKDEKPPSIAVIFDAGRDTFRNRIYDQYKAHRPPPPDDLIPQFALVREATEAFGLPSIELADWEADDLIASYARAATEAGGHVTIVSSDKDLLQLLRAGVAMVDPIKQKSIGPEDVMEKYGVLPGRMTDMQALIGDKVDNVPGVPGIGPKNAAALLDEYGDLESVLAAAPSMKPSKRRDMLIEHAEAARLSRRLVELSEAAPLPAPIEALAARPPDPVRLNDWLIGMGFRSIANRLALKGANDAPPPPQAAPVTPAGPAQTEMFARPEAAPAAAKPTAGFGPYETITEPAGVVAWADAARLAGRIGMAALTEAGACLGIALATAPGRAAYIPAAVDASALDAVFADPSVLKIFHDAKAAMRALDMVGRARPAPVDDVELLSYATDGGRHGHALGDLAVLHLAHNPAERDAVTGTGRARTTLADAPAESVAAHAAEQADVVLRLWSVLRPRLRIECGLALYEQIERRLIPVLLDAERAGIRIDADELRRMSVDFERRMDAMEKEIHRLAGRPFNLGSTKQLGEVLFDEMGLPGGKRMKTGAWGTDAQVLTALAELGHALPALILDWRQLAKLKSTYADALVDEADPRTGRIHTRFAMAATTTGRLSSIDPNLQNIPIRTEEGAAIRRAFVADPGNVLVSCDYSQIELRLLAHVADLPTLRESFAAGEDIHARTASEVFGVPMAGMDPMTRRRAKAINFGIIYGISAFGLGRQLGIPPAEAKLTIDAYFARYPGIRDYMEKTREEARIAGYVTTPFGRRCWIPGIADRNPARRGYAERQAINAPLQGGAADIIKRAMVRLPAALAAAGLGDRARLLLQVHDELLFEAPADDAPALAAVAKRVMEAAVSLAVPLVVETGIGHSWAEAH
jgi:DNA polymerase-1